MPLSRTTRDHQDIRSWAEARGGKPAEVGGTDSGGESGILRLEFPDAPHANDSKLQEISWDEFFEKFDERGLAMILQDVTAEGAESNFNRFVYPENVRGEVIPNTSGEGGDESEDDEQFEDAAVDEPGDVDADSGDPDDEEFVHDTAADEEGEGEGEEEGLDTAVKSASASGAKRGAKKSAAKKAASKKTTGAKGDSPRTASKASAKKATTNSARGRH